MPFGQSFKGSAFSIHTVFALYDGGLLWEDFLAYTYNRCLRYTVCHCISMHVLAFVAHRLPCRVIYIFLLNDST